MHKFRRLLLLCLTSSSLFAQGPRNDQWMVLGPGGGGAQFYPAVSPHDDGTVLTACDMTGSYISLDGGSTWRMFNLRGVSRLFGFDPANPDVLYAGANALWRSDDHGKTWRVIYPDPKSVTGSSMGNDHADESLLVNGKPAPRPRAFAVHPAHPEYLYLAVQDGADVVLLVSQDRGASWNTRQKLTGARKVYVGRDGVVYVIGDRAVTVIEGERSRTGAPIEGILDASAGFTDDGKFIIYAVTRSMGYISEDAGATWRDYPAPGRYVAIATSLNNPDIAYASYSGAEDGAFGVVKITDRGHEVKYAWRETSTQPSDNIHDAWLTAKFGSSWAGSPLTLGVSPTNANVVFGTDYGRTMRSTDAGASWRAVYSRGNAEGWTTTGLDVTTAYGVHFDPFDANRIFISYTDIGAFRSEDGGRTWVSSTDGVARSWTNTTYSIEFDPEVRNRVWGVFSGTHDLPRPKMWRSNSPQKYRGGVGISEDGGRTWRMLTNAGIPETAATHILLDPTSPSDSRTLYVAGFGRGVYKSTDGGKSWAAKNNGIEGPEPFAWRLARDKEGGLYLVVARRSEDGSIGNGEDGALYFSGDAAETWKRLPLPEGVNGPNGLAIDPENSKRLYLATWSRRGSMREMGGGIWRSDDAGQTWSNVFAGDQHVYDVTIDPRNPNVLYACGFESSAWRSADRGATWTRIRGYNFKWGHRVVPDPRDPTRIFVTTFGGSVWHGPAEGDAAAAEDIDAPWLTIGARTGRKP